jgi:archaellum component FlaC
MMASASSKEDGTSLSFDELEGDVLEVELASEGVGEGVRDVDDDVDVDTRRRDHECCGTLKRWH